MPLASPSTIAPGAAQPPFVVTLDVGSSSIRAMLFDARARAIDGMESRIEHVLATPEQGASEDDADGAVRRVATAIDDLLAQIGPLADQIGGVGMDCYAPTLIGIDAQGNAITPVYTYADTRNAAQVARLRQTVDSQSAHERTGTHLHTSYLPARILWLRDTYPQQVRNVRRWACLPDYIFGRLLHSPEARAISLSLASWTGLLNRHSLEWDAEWLRVLDLAPDALPSLTDVSRSVCGLSDAYAARWPALHRVPWFPAVGDGAAANIGSDCVGGDRVALTVGTTAALRVVLTESPTAIPWGLWLYRVDSRRSLLGGATTEGGNIFAWLTDRLRLGTDSDAADREVALATIPPDSHGLTILPFWGGERSPGWVGEATGTVSGLTLHTQAIDILRASLESIAYRFGLIDRLLSGVTSPSHTIIASGGALLRSPAWMQIVADVLNRPIMTSGIAEATSRGVAILALEALGCAPPSPHDGDTEAASPIPAHVAIYQKATERQHALYRTIVGADR